MKTEAEIREAMKLIKMSIETLDTPRLLKEARITLDNLSWAAGDPGTYLGDLLDKLATDPALARLRERHGITGLT